MTDIDLADLIRKKIENKVLNAKTKTQYRKPICAWTRADDPQWNQLSKEIPNHMMPSDLLPSARMVVSFFIPFKPGTVKPNRTKGIEVAEEWVRAYLETNELIKGLTCHLIDSLEEQGIKAAAEPPTDNFNRETLKSRWSHKSVAVVTGLGSFGLHHMIITDAECCGRLGSLVIDAELPLHPPGPANRCLYKHDGSCAKCIERCPIGALSQVDPIDRQACWNRCLNIMDQFSHIGRAEVCGKCAFGPCAYTNPVKEK